MPIERIRTALCLALATMFLGTLAQAQVRDADVTLAAEIAASAEATGGGDPAGSAEGEPTAEPTRPPSYLFRSVTFHLAGNRVVEGRVTTESPTLYVVEKKGGGLLTIRRDDVERVELSYEKSRSEAIDKIDEGERLRKSRVRCKSMKCLVDVAHTCGPNELVWVSSVDDLGVVYDTAVKFYLKQVFEERRCFLEVKVRDVAVRFSKALTDLKRQEGRSEAEIEEDRRELQARAARDVGARMECKVMPEVLVDVLRAWDAKGFKVEAPVTGCKLVK